MLLLIDIFSINKGRGYENPILEIIITESCSIGGCPLEEACEHCFMNQSDISMLFLYHLCVIVEIMLDILLLFFHFQHFISVFHIYYIWYLAKIVPQAFSNRHDLKMPHALYYLEVIVQYFLQREKLLFHSTSSLL